MIQYFKNIKFCFFLFLLSTVPVSLLGQKSKKPTYEEDFLKDKEIFFHNQYIAIKEGNWSNLDSAVTQLNSAVNFFRTYQRQCELSAALGVKGRVFYDFGAADSATVSFILASKHNKADCPLEDQYYLYNSWSMMYLDMDDFLLSDSLNLLALKATKALGNKNLELNVLTNRAIIFSNVGQIDMSISIMKDIHNIALQTNDSYHIWSSLQNLGAFYSMSDRHDSAFYFLHSLAELVNEETPPQLVMDLYNNLAVIHQENKDYELAADNYLNAIQLARQHNELNSLLIYLENYSVVLKILNQFEESRSFLRAYIDLKDSLLSAEKIQIMKKLEKEYETGKQKEIIHQLEKEDLANNLKLAKANRIRDIAFIVIISVLLLSYGLYRRLIVIRKSKLLVEKEKKRSDDLLLNILPEQVAEELKQTGVSEARDFDEVSVLFTDFVKFTEFSQLHSAKELVSEIGYCFKAFDEICSQYNIEKIKTIGDAYMAAGGVPIEDKNATTNTVKAALAMQDFIQKRCIELEAQELPVLRMRAGVHTGSIVAGIVGVKKFQYDIWGDTVNTASRLESVGESDRVNISKSTYDRIVEVPEFSFIKRGKVEAKGKGAIEMFYVSLKT